MIKHQLWWYSFYGGSVFFFEMKYGISFRKKLTLSHQLCCWWRCFPHSFIRLFGLWWKPTKIYIIHCMNVVFGFLVFMVIITWWQDDIIHSFNIWKQYPFENNDDNVDDDSTMTMWWCQRPQFSSFFSCLF